MIFGNEEGEHSYLSPFSRHSIRENGVVFSSVYNYYVYRKFNNLNAVQLKSLSLLPQERVLMQQSNSRTNRVVPNWDVVKYDVMKRGFMLKFEQHPVLKKKFEKLEHLEYKYNVPSFTYWGYTGDNKLNELLGELRMYYGFQYLEVDQQEQLQEQLQPDPQPEQLQPDPQPEDNIDNNSALLLMLG